MLSFLHNVRLLSSAQHLRGCDFVPLCSHRSGLTVLDSFSRSSSPSMFTLHTKQHIWYTISYVSCKQCKHGLCLSWMIIHWIVWTSSKLFFIMFYSNNSLSVVPGDHTRQATFISVLTNSCLYPFLGIG